ncbi:glycosyltransferase family 39 protein [Solidesulfovibrio aerotolerans]|uniref:glycosyltransferase family 39 protein n=1 Tax=Solidesulfovibrio aerotolerans TaxID=295255 RepID=UPI0031B565D2
MQNLFKKINPWPILLFLVALALRLYELGGPSMAFHDELTTLARSLEPSFAEVLAAAIKQFPPFIDFQPPLYYLVTHGVVALGGHGDFWVRLPAALAGAVCAPLLYWLGLRLGGPVCGVFAGAAVAVNLYHIDVSQQVRLYALWGALTLAGLLALMRALNGGRRRDWAVFALALAAGFYTSYLALGLLVLAALLTAWALAVPGRDAPARRRTLLGFLGASAAAVAAFWPWLEVTSGVRGYLLDAAVPLRPPLYEALTTVFAAFSSHYATVIGRPELPWLMAGAAVAGLLLGLARAAQRRSAILVAVLFVVFFGLAWGRASAAHPFQVRYGLPCLFATLLAAGLGLAALADWLRRRGVGAAAGQGLALVLGLALAAPSLPVAPFFYRRDDSRLKTLAAALRAAAGPATSLALWRESDPWLRPYFETFARWYLPGVFLTALPDASPAGRQARDMLLLVPATPGTPPPAGARLVTALAGTEIWHSPVANATPLVPSDGFTARFAPDVAFAELTSSRNVRATGSSLVLAESVRAGEAVYVFTPQPGQRVALTGLEWDTETASYPGQSPSGRVIALVGPDAEHLTPYDSDSPPPPAESLMLRLYFRPGYSRGPLALTRLDARFAVSGDPGPPAAVAAEQARRLAANTQIAPCPAGTIFPDRYVLGPDGTVCPAVGRLASDASLTLANATAAPLAVTRLDLTGNPGGAAVSLGATQFQLPLAGPQLLTAALVPGGPGTVRLAPLYTDAGFNPDAALPGATAVKRAGEPVLTCPDAKPCEILYELTTGYPAKRLELTWFPRLLGDAAGHNNATAEIAVGDGPFQSLDSFSSLQSGRWDGLGVTRRAATALGGATGRIRLRLRLAGDGAQLWSSPETPMALTLAVDTGSLPPLAIAPGTTPMTAAAPGPWGITVGFDTP